MPITSIKNFEKNEDIYFLNNNCPNYPFRPFSKKLKTKLVDESDHILEFIRQNHDLLYRPYGYEILTKSGNLRYKNNWKSENKLALKMQSLGFDALRKDFEDAFKEYEIDTGRIKNVSEDDIAFWKLGLAQSAAALFMVHVMNIYHPQRGLFSNIIDANVQVDALGRTNFEPAISAISKVIKKTLGWKGDVFSQDFYRAEMIILLAFLERKEKRNIVHVNRGVEFEKKCAKLLIENGFDVSETPTTGDFGADLIAEKDGIIFAIQCKDLNKPVGVKGVQEAVGARRHYVADFACVCSDSGFTEAALELAATNRVVTASSGNLADSLGRTV